MYTCLYKFLSVNNICYKKQYGFRTNHSCEQVIQDLYEHISQNNQDVFKTAVFT